MDNSSDLIALGMYCSGGDSSSSGDSGSDSDSDSGSCGDSSSGISYINIEK